jgi:hypothetical protein
MSHIFISYSAEDRERVRPLVSLLGDVAPVWWDQAVRHGENWELAVEKAVEQAACVVVAWTQHSVQSSWVRSEAADARDRAILVPALLEEVKVPLAFRHLQTAQLQGWNGDPEHPQAQALRSAVSAVVARAPAAPAPTPLPPTHAGVGRDRTALPARHRLGRSGVGIAAAVVAAVLIGTLGWVGYRLTRPSSGSEVQPSGSDRSLGSVGMGVPLATPAVVDPKSGAIPSSPSGDLATGKKVAYRLLVEDTATTDLSEALARRSFDYLVDQDGRVVSGVRDTSGRGVDLVAVGVVHAPSWIAIKSYQPYTDAQITALVALLTNLAHKLDLDVQTADFGQDPKMSELGTRADEVRQRVSKLLAIWRAQGAMPDEARVAVGSRGN